jgi:RND family efflux transporter MFP subunit
MSNDSPNDARRPLSPKPRPGERTGRPAVMIGMVLVILAIGFGIAFMLVKAKAEPPREESVDVGPLVEAVIVHPASVNVMVTGNGTAEPRQEIDLTPQVSGKVIAVHDQLIAGGVVPADTTLIQIDPADFKLAVQRAEASLAQAEAGVQTATAALRRAETALDVEQAEAEVAIEEWKANRGEEAVPDLVARRPQIRERQADVASAKAQLTSAKASVQSAEAALAEAKLALARTSIAVPFAGRVRSESVDVGQFVVSGQPLAQVYSTDVIQVVVPFQDKQLQWFDVPDPSSVDQAAEPVPATVTADFAGQEQVWQGRVVRDTGQVDLRSRMVHVVIEVDDPFGKANSVPLMPGMFVSVQIEGDPLADAIRIPRFALRAEDKVWVDREGKLRVVEVSVARTDRQYAYVTEGLVDGDRVITSQMDFVVDGMAVRTPEDMLTRSAAARDEPTPQSP